MLPPYAVCLRQREIPFMIYSGYRRFPVACRAEVVVRKPVHPDVIVRAVVDLCRRHRAKARPQRLVRSGALDPPRLAMLGKCTMRLWTDIGVEFGSDPRVIATAQGVLASIIIDFAWDGQFGAPELTRIAGRLMRNFIDPTTTRTPTAKKSPPR